MSSPASGNPASSSRFFAAASAAASPNSQNSLSQSNHSETASQEDEDTRKPASLRFTMSSLPDAIQSLADTFGKRFLKLVTLRRQKQTQVTKLNRDDFIPRSATFDFTLKGTKRVEDSDDFKTLAADIKHILSTATNQLKTKMSAVATLEIKKIDEDLNDCFFKAIMGLSQLILLNRNHQDPTPPIRELSILCLEKHASRLSKYQPFDELTVFDAFHSVDKDQAKYMRGTLGNDFKLLLARDCHTLNLIMHHTFVIAWESQLAIMEEKDKQNLLEQAKRSIIKEGTTAATAAAMDLEESIDNKTMEALIAEQVSKRMNMVNSQIGRLEQKLDRKSGAADSTSAANSANQKNEGRGTQKSRASNKKPNPTTKPPTNRKAATGGKAKPAPRTQPNRASDTAAARDNAGSRNSKKPKQGKPQKQNTSHNKNKSVVFSSSTKK